MWNNHHHHWVATTTSKLRPWLYRAAKTGGEEEEPEGLRKRSAGRREMWGHQQHVGREGGGGGAFVLKIFWRGSNKGRGERGQEGGGELRWLRVRGGGVKAAVNGCFIREECEGGEEQTGRKQQGAPE